MTRRLVRLTPALRKDERGVTTIEFAFLAPVLLGFIIGICQLGILFMANAGLASAVSDGARLATIFPRPTDAQVIARINERRLGMETSRITGPTITRGTTAAGASYADISMSYSVPLNFIFYSTAPITLTETRRVYTN
jgi:Flp pilus assembly protein TadG